MCAWAAKALRAWGSGCAGMLKRAESASAIAGAVSTIPAAQTKATHAIFRGLAREKHAHRPATHPIVVSPVVVGLAPRCVARCSRGNDSWGTENPQCVSLVRRAT